MKSFKHFPKLSDRSDTYLAGHSKCFIDFVNLIAEAEPVRCTADVFFNYFLDISCLYKQLTVER